MPLRRELGLIDAVALGLGAVIGAGIFVVIGIAAGVAGPGLLLGLGLAGIAATANALSTAHLAAAYPQAGGAYEYAYRVLSPWAGAVAGWMFLFSKIAAAGTVALGLDAYFAALAPGIPPRLVAIAAIGIFTALNYVGIKRSSRVNLVIVAISIGSLLLFVSMGIGTVRAGQLLPLAPHGTRGVLQSGALMFFAYTGYARVATLAEEVRQPERTIPQAIVWTLIGAIVLYAAVAFVALGTVGADELASTSAPLYTAARRLSGISTATFVAIGAIVAMLGVVLSQLLALSRMTLAMARRGDLPRYFDRVNPRFAVPGRAVLMIGLVTAIVAGLGTLHSIAAAASFAILVYYAIANLAALRLPRPARRYPDAVPIAGLIGCAILAVTLPAEAIVGGLAALIAGLALHFVRQRS